MATPAQTIAGHLYEGILSPGDWALGLEGIRQQTDAGVFHHVTWDLQAQCVLQGIANEEQPESKVREYEVHHAPHDPRMPIIMQMGVGRVLWDHEHFSARTMDRSPIYADWLAPLGYRHTLGIPVFDDGHTREWVCMIRHSDQEAFGSGEQAFLQQLMPDLLRAARLRSQAAHLAVQAAMGFAALETSHQAVVLLGADGSIRYMNPAAQRTTLPARGLAVRAGRFLGCTDASAQAQLEHAVKRACRRHGSAGATTLRSLPGAHGVLLQVLPLQAGHALAQLHQSEPCALVLWSTPPTEWQAARISEALGITETEARLAIAWTMGLSVKDFATQHGCSWHTARVHAKNLMRKTGCHRQADVVRLVQTLASA
jgi:DNA-binding CsgD family transcriptional regulator/PAS domain-containing protein